MPQGEADAASLRVKMRILRSPGFWIGSAVSVGALALAVRGLDFRGTGEALADANYWLLIPSLAILSLVLYGKAVRWVLLFQPDVDVRLSSSFGTMNVGYMVNGILPLRVGELARAYMMGEVEGISKARTLSTILVERVLDVLALILLMLLILPFVEMPGWAIGPTIGFGVGFLLLAAVLIGITLWREGAVGLARRLIRLMPTIVAERLDVMAESAIDGLSALSRPWILARVAALSIIVWLGSALVFLVGLEAFDIDAARVAPIFLVVVTSLGMTVPSSPGYIGVFHAITIESLVGVFGVAREAAVGYALVQHLVFYLPPILIGAGYLWRSGASPAGLTNLFSRGRATDQEVAPPATG